MVINEKGLLRAMKEAYNAEGYEIECKESGGVKEIHLETTRWYVMCVLKNMPRKVLGLIVEHLGALPEPGEAFQVKKKETQTKICSAYRDAFQGITPDDCINPPKVYKSKLVYRFGNVWQQGAGLKVYWIDPEMENIMLMTTQPVCLGGKALHVSGTVSGVSIAHSIPTSAEDRRMLDYLAGIQLYEK